MVGVRCSVCGLTAMKGTSALDVHPKCGRCEKGLKVVLLELVYQIKEKLGAN